MAHIEIFNVTLPLYTDLVGDGADNIRDALCSGAYLGRKKRFKEL